MSHFQSCLAALPSQTATEKTSLHKPRLPRRHLAHLTQMRSRHQQRRHQRMSRGISAPQSRPPLRSACTRGAHSHIHPCLPVRPHDRRAQCLRRGRVRRHQTELGFSAAYAGEWQHLSAAAGSDRSSPHATAVHACDARSHIRTHAQMDTGSARHCNTHVSQQMVRREEPNGLCHMLRE